VKPPRLLLAAALAAATAAGLVEAASPPAVAGGGGAVASGDVHATEAGLAVLADGGNAVDAAVAVALTLAVSFPEAGNLGGGGFAVVRLGETVSTLDFREVAPAGASRDMFLGPDGEPVRERSLVGPLAAGVPGSPAGLWELHRRFGRLPWPRVVEPARRLAADGLVVGPHLARAIEAYRDKLEPFPETAATWLPGGRPPAVGSRLVQPDLAATLAAYAERGPGAITEGPVAAAVEAASLRHGGVLAADDLAAYRPVWRQPVRFEAFGWSFAGMDLPSSGAMVLGQTFGMLERLGWAAKPRAGADRAHLLAETWRRAFADRFLLADPATSQATVAELLAPGWLDRRAASIDPAHATPSAAVGNLRRPAAEVEAATAAEPSHTTQVSVVDAEGNLVALTTTLNDLFGCGLWVPGAGFFLNDEMDDFTAAPGAVNVYGLVQGEANAVAPGKRMLSSMSPTLAWRDGEAVAAGGRGGSKIISSTAQLLLGLIVDGEPLQAAVDRPRIHHQWLPDAIQAEPDALSPETRAELERRGHRVEVTAAAAGRSNAVRRLADGSVEAAVDPRGPGAAGVVTPRFDRRVAEPPPEPAPAQAPPGN
jgi:gamma-glutamyltranspeptidase/glutathione hydrolase